MERLREEERRICEKIRLEQLHQEEERRLATLREKERWQREKIQEELRMERLREEERSLRSRIRQEDLQWEEESRSQRLEGEPPPTGERAAEELLQHRQASNGKEFPEDEIQLEEERQLEEALKESRRLEDVRLQRQLLESQLESRQKLRFQEEDRYRAQARIGRDSGGLISQPDPVNRGLRAPSVIEGNEYGFTADLPASPDRKNQESSRSVISHSSESNLGVHRNEVDSWIDDLDINRSSYNPLDASSGGISAGVLMASLLQQSLPKVEIPPFNGAALNWVEFVVKFRDVVHDLPYLTDKQRSQLLMQHLRGEAKQAVQEYVNDPRGYPLALKKLKF